MMDFVGRLPWLWLWNWTVELYSVDDHFCLQQQGAPSLTVAASEIGPPSRRPFFADGSSGAELC